MDGIGCTRGRVGTEGGEALAVIETLVEAPSGEALAGGVKPTGEAWYVLWTRSNCEQQVHDQLCAKGFAPFLPRVEVWSRRGVVRQIARVPMFPGYLFLRHAMDKTAYIEIVKAQGLVRILGERWDRLAAVPEMEVDAIQRVVRERLPVRRWAYLREGQRVRITRGPLADVEGVLVRDKPNKGMLVVSVHMLQRSVAVEVDCTLVVPA
jgi:transcription antitermination factor NusG